MESLQPPRPFSLRMSNIGKGARQLWYDKQYGREEKFPPATVLKFIYGDVIQSILYFSLPAWQDTVLRIFRMEVVLNGIKGHIDAEIDGVTVDVKSASEHAFRKFSAPKDDPRGLVENDSFGYVEQIARLRKG